MKDLKADTSAIIAAADHISAINKGILDKMNDPQAAVSRLDATWDSPASDEIIGRFITIKQTYNETRYNVIDNFVKFLHLQVGEGYTSAEEANRALAETFK